MAGNDNWIYQGRQYHMWFGHGTRPAEDKPAPASKDALPPLQDRIHKLGYTLAAGLPGSQRHHAVARLDTPDQGRLARVMTGVVHALPLGPRLIPIRVLGTNADAPGVATFVKAGAALQSAHSNADLRNATDLVARSAQEMGLDRFRPFLRQADDHLAQTGGMAALLRETAPAPAPLAAPRTPTPPGTSAPPPLPPPGALMPLIGRLLRGAGWLVLAGTLLDGLIRANQETQVRAAIERFKLDPSKPADMAAALAYAWARTNRSLLMGTALPESAQDAVAEQVMRAVRADPALLDRAMAGDPAALGTLRSIVQTVASGRATITRNEEERQLVDKMVAEGKTDAEIQMALDDLRKQAGMPSRIDLPKNPDDLLKNGWIETTHPEAGASGHREFENPQTGEKISFDKGRAGEHGFEGLDHFHRINLNPQSKRESNLDVHGNPVPRGSKRSHIIAGE